MTKNKGFTLIELLAVIVVLAIIALIAVPMILGVIEKARKGSAEASALGYIDAIEKKIALDALKGVNYEDKDDYVFDEIEVNVKGNKPNGGLYSLENSMVTNATFCIEGYKVVYDKDAADKRTQATEKCTAENMKLKSDLVLSKYISNIFYPETDEVEVTENTSGEEISCSSADESIATCSINGNKITIVAGQGDGDTTITVKAKANSKYKEGQAAIEVLSTKGNLLSISANGYSDTYDGDPHSISVQAEGATITYGLTEGVYDLIENPSFTDAGTYTVYYKISKRGYHDIVGSKNVVITQLTASQISHGDGNLQDALDDLARKLN